MKITILGCGGSGGVPMIGGDLGQGIWGNCDPHEPRNVRTRSSIVMESAEGARILVDSGPDIRSQLLREQIGAVQGVIYTHEHADHVAGLDELRAINRMIDAPLPIYATESVLDELKARFAYVFKPWTGPNFYRPVVQSRQIELFDCIDLHDFSIRTFGQRHGRIPSLGLRCGSFAYSTDVEHLDAAALSVLEGVDCWVVDCFQYAPHVAHAWLEQVLEWRDILRPSQTILTHMGPEMDYATLCRELPRGVEPAYDGMVITVD